MLKLMFDLERETKNTVRFAERGSDEPPVIGTLYVQKHALKSLGEPAVLVVTLEAGEAS